MNALIIMIKNPVKGNVKTRLAEEIGDDKALQIYMELLLHTEHIASGMNCDRFLFYSDLVARHDMFPNDRYKKYVQCSGDLGARMDYAFSIPFKDEYKKAVMIGSDCFAIATKHIELAFQKLDENDFVIGPATDGGYYLIGMKKWNRDVFKNKGWSTGQLFRETKDEIIHNNGKLSELESLSDVDTIDDVKKIPELNKLL